MKKQFRRNSNDLLLYNTEKTDFLKNRFLSEKMVAGRGLEPPTSGL